MNILDKKTIKRVVLAALVGICGALILMLGMIARLHAFNSIERLQALDEDGEYLHVGTLIYDGWVKEMPEDFAYPSLST